MSAVLASLVYTLATIVIVLFQFALAMGAPWGHLAMGGRFEGRFPPSMRVAAVIQALLLSGLAVIVLADAGVAFGSVSSLAGVGIWVVVVISAVSLLLNLITPSRQERMLWAPVALLMFASSLFVAWV